MSNTDWLSHSITLPDAKFKKSAQNRQASLTKPLGALGHLENIAIRLASMQGNERPKVDKIHISVFAGDHGIATQNVSAFPQAVTTEMVKNFARGGAAISVLAKQLSAKLEVINLGTINDPGKYDNVRSEFIASSTVDFTTAPAMTLEQVSLALNSGRQAVERAIKNKSDIYIGGEMGIGNTTSATAIASVLLGESPEDMVGKGTGIDSEGMNRKLEAINNGIFLHFDSLKDPLEILRCLGGFEIVALTGSYISCAIKGIPVLIDGFISSVAALCATKINPLTKQWFIYSHNSAEPGHKTILAALSAKPLLDLGMRLGEGSGAAVAITLLKSACDLHNNMATFDEAGVSEKSE